MNSTNKKKNTYIRNRTVSQTNMKLSKMIIIKRAILTCKIIITNAWNFKPTIGYNMNKINKKGKRKKKEREIIKNLESP